MDAPFGSCGTQTLIAGLRADAMIAPWVIKGAMDGGAFAAYVEKVLPPYSPGLNRIEKAFSKLKAHLHRIGARTFTDMFNAIAESCDLYSPEECWNYFTAAGYVAG